MGEDLDAALDAGAPRHWGTVVSHHPPAPLPEGAVPLSHFVHGPQVLSRRLQQIGVVDPELGPRLLDRLVPGQRLVSRQGDLWRWDGFIQTSSAQSTAAERLAQRNRLAELEKAIRHASTEAGVMRDIYHARREEAERHEESERTLRQTAREASEALANARTELAACERDAERRASQSASLDEQEARLATDRGDIETRLADDTAALGTLDAAGTGEAELASLREEVARMRAGLAEAQANFDRLRLEAESRQARLDALRTDEADWRQRIEGSQTQAQRLKERQTESQTALGEASQKPQALEEQHARLLDQIQIADTRRAEAADALATAEGTHKNATSSRAASESALGQARETMARLEASGEAARTRIEEVGALIRERLDCEPEDAIGLADVDLSDGLPPRDDVESKLDDLRRAREAMGAVNLRAEAEAEEHQTRLEELRNERDDLEEAIGRLRQAISNLNREARTRLTEAFTVVAGHFERLFTHLFEGGSAELKLVDSDDPLEAGLEIFARPPGKRLQSMSLLSGGEQALTAMALISAVFLANPAPICVLDEVDAPLDDTNVERFCNLIDELRRQTETRFLVITHHPLTMSRLDRLFGVTMAERGVSQLVSVDLDGARDVLLAS
jgi:chromosome segregation protein